ncbi:MAG: serine hydroxymethyltransferase [Candidatus Aenigmarchaeota archaeon]|nr:serine hydroxymethyltransferase [Candidatus Aenigmarchaeota archaeon]
MLEQTDPEIYNAIKNEQARQINGLEMIPSENYVSDAVLSAMGSILTNKYSEGYPGKRYYGGNHNIDVIETLAVERAKKLFDVSHANVQPLSGSPANQAVYFALLNLGDKVMGLHLFFGGHLTHGWKVNFSGKFYTPVNYQTSPNGFLDYDALEKQARQENPKLIFCGATAYPRLYDYKRLGEIAHSIDAYFVADIAHEAGLIAAKVVPSPARHADVITTTTHKTLRGPRGGMIMCDGNPSEPLKPLPEDANPRENLPTLIDRAIFPGLQGGPHNHTTAGIAVALHEAMQPGFKMYAQQILRNAKVLAECLMGYGFNLVTNGTDNHLMLVDLQNKNITGKEAEKALEDVGITVNKNTIPYDPRKPYNPSGIRLGTPALTTRGMKESEMRLIAELISKAIEHSNDSNVKEKLNKDVIDLCKGFPIFKYN